MLFSLKETNRWTQRPLAFTWATSSMLCCSQLSVSCSEYRRGRECRRTAGQAVWVQVMETECFRQTNSQPCPLGSPLSGVYLINCSYNYQTWGHQHYSAAHGPHRRTCSLTQLLAVLKRRRRQARDPASVTPEVLVLCCRGNVPHLHWRITAKRRAVEGEGTRHGSYRERETSDENRLKTFKCQSQGWKYILGDWGRKTNPCQREREWVGTYWVIN